MTAISALPGSGYDTKATLSSRQPVKSTIEQQESPIIRLARLSGSEGEKLDPATLPEDLYSAYMELQRDRQEVARIHLKLQSIPETASAPKSPRTEAYAKIVVGNKTVATIDNQGVVGINDDALGARLQSVLSGDINGTNGPDLAQARAEQLAQLLGGKIEKSSTALTQSAFDALPPATQSWTVDYERFKDDPLYSQLQSWRAAYEEIQERRAAYTSGSCDSAA